MVLSQKSTTALKINKLSQIVLPKCNVLLPTAPIYQTMLTNDFKPDEIIEALKKEYGDHGMIKEYCSIYSEPFQKSFSEEEFFKCLVTCISQLSEEIVQHINTTTIQVLKKKINIHRVSYFIIFDKNIGAETHATYERYYYIQEKINEIFAVPESEHKAVQELSKGPALLSLFEWLIEVVFSLNRELSVFLEHQLNLKHFFYRNVLIMVKQCIRRYLDGESRIILGENKIGPGVMYGLSLEFKDPSFVQRHDKNLPWIDINWVLTYKDYTKRLQLPLPFISNYSEIQKVAAQTLEPLITHIDSYTKCTTPNKYYTKEYRLIFLEHLLQGGYFCSEEEKLFFYWDQDDIKNALIIFENKLIDYKITFFRHDDLALFKICLYLVYETLPPEILVAIVMSHQINLDHWKYDCGGLTELILNLNIMKSLAYLCYKKLKII